MCTIANYYLFLEVHVFSSYCSNFKMFQHYETEICIVVQWEFVLI